MSISAFIRLPWFVWPSCAQEREVIMKTVPVRLSTIGVGSQNSQLLSSEATDLWSAGHCWVGNCLTGSSSVCSLLQLLPESVERLKTTSCEVGWGWGWGRPG